MLLTESSSIGPLDGFAEYEISEDPVGLYALPNTKADTLYTVLTDILTRCSLPLSMCRGQAYDGASNIQGRRNGILHACSIKQHVKFLIIQCLKQTSL